MMPKLIHRCEKNPRELLIFHTYFFTFSREKKIKVIFYGVNAPLCFSFAN